MTGGFGFSLMAPGWLFPIAEATPMDPFGSPILIDETIRPFNPDLVQKNDIVAVGITTGNCIGGYRVVKQAKEKGAIVVVGGIHATILPDEPIEFGADTVVTGNGDIVWPKVLDDILNKKLLRRYIGGRVAGGQMRKGRWELFNPKEYLCPVVRLKAGCPEVCTFCSVWKTDGNEMRNRSVEDTSEEINYLYHTKGCRIIILGDDNEFPASLARIAREKNTRRHAEFERLREEDLKFCREFAKRVPKDIVLFTQMTSECANDDEAIEALKNMGIKAALWGIESFNEETLRKIKKGWNPNEWDMVDSIKKVQKKGIYILGSMISGLETDTVETLQAAGRFAREAGLIMAQFTVFSAYLETNDYNELVADVARWEQVEAGNPLALLPRRKIKLLTDLEYGHRFWLNPKKRMLQISHPNMDEKILLGCVMKNWQDFYSYREIWRRLRMWGWPFKAKILYVLVCRAFIAQYAGYGIAADSVKTRKLAKPARIQLKLAIWFCNRFLRVKSKKPDKNQ
jgi:radical SAM superfamily enzyme YgiQ (UPF0313 family)